MIDHKKKAEASRKDPTHPEYEGFKLEIEDTHTHSNCLRCNKRFIAQSRFNKICSKCKERDAWKLHPEIKYYSPN